MGAKQTPDREDPSIMSGDSGGLHSGSAGGPIGDPGLDVIEVVGAIKWFDVAKGFGFIVPDDGRPDVLLDRKSVV